MREAWIIDAVRSPRGRGKPGVGSLSEMHPQRCMAQVLNGLRDRVGFDPADIEDVVAGCGTGSGDHAHDIARMSVLDAGWPISVTGVTLHRFCGSGQQAVNFAAMGVMSGQQDLVVGGGVESMSRVPMGSDNAGIDGNNTVLRSKIFQVPQGISADLIATIEGFSREDVDRFASESQAKAERAQKEGLFDRSLVPVKDPTTGEVGGLEGLPPRLEGGALAGFGGRHAQGRAPAVVAEGILAGDPGEVGSGLGLAECLPCPCSPVTGPELSDRLLGLARLEQREAVAGLGRIAFSPGRPAQVPERGVRVARVLGVARHALELAPCPGDLVLVLEQQRCEVARVHGGPAPALTGDLLELGDRARDVARPGDRASALDP